jgi:hypothetical protein
MDSIGKTDDLRNERLHGKLILVESAAEGERSTPVPSRRSAPDQCSDRMRR